VARAYARTATNVKGRGRLRIIRELEAIGITREIARSAVADALGDSDEASLIDRAVQKKIRGKRLTNRQDRARLYNFLVRQGFTAEAASAALRRAAAGATDEEAG
jgi:SOS response regulatory protein OraA/RecX